MATRRQQIASQVCQSANCVSKAVISDLVQQKVPETLVSEIVKPSPAAAELLNVSAPLAAAATGVSVGPSGDVEMTPDQTQQNEDADLRKIVATLHVNLGHPSNDVFATAIRLFGGSESMQAALVRCTLSTPHRAHSCSCRFSQTLAWHLTSSCLQTSHGKTVFS